MNSSMISAATSMRGLQQKIDLIAHNVSNLQTVGYKRQDASFFDLLTSVQEQQDNVILEGRRTPPGLTLDWGSALSRTESDFTQGHLVQTDQPLDVAIEGQALFEIAHVRLSATGEPLSDADGRPILDRVWTRNGSWQLSERPGDTEHLYLSTKEGQLLRGLNDELLRVPRNHRIELDTDGNVWAYPNDLRRSMAEEDETEAAMPDGNEEAIEGNLQPVHVGQLKIVRMIQPQMLESIGGDSYRVRGGEAAVDGVLQVVDLNVRNEQTESIAIRQGFLEQSNVDIGQEMTELITLQRSLQFHSRALASADEMMAMTNKLRG